MLAPVTLTHASLVLRPMRLDDAPALAAVAAECPNEFAYMPSTPMQPDYVAKALAARDAGEHLPFVVEVDGVISGSTRYGDIRETDRALEIGWTWYHPRVQGTWVNPAAKRLLLAHAFEDLGMLRVQLKTDGRNARSQRAIAKLGAVREGTLRMHSRMPDGYQRDTVFFSIIAPEWPALRDALDARIAAQLTAT